MTLSSISPTFLVISRLLFEGPAATGCCTFLGASWRDLVALRGVEGHPDGSFTN